MQRLAQDLRLAARFLWKARAFTAIVLVVLGLGMGATTAIFSVVDTVLLKPLPFRDPERLLVLWENNPAQKKSRLFPAVADFFEWRRRSHTLEEMAAILDTRINLTGGPNGHVDPEELRAERVSTELFPLLGVQAVLGRTFVPEEDRPGQATVVLLSHRLWERRFGADRRIAGKSIRLRDQSYTVVGVLPPGFGVLDPAVDLWLPLGLNPADPRTAAYRELIVVARRRAGVDMEQVRTEMESIGRALEQSNPALNKGWQPSVFRLQEELVGKVREALLVLLGAVGCLLLMACANVANLLLARGAARRKDAAIRIAVGAGRSRVVTQLLCESAVLGVLGGALGLGLAKGALVLMARLGAHAIPRLNEVRLDARLFLFSLAVALVTGILFGIAPALHVSGSNLNSALLESGRGGTPGRPARRLRDILVVCETALAVVVLIGAGLLMRSFLSLRATDPGFRPSGLLSFRLPLAGGRNAQVDRRIAFFASLTEKLAALPGARDVGAVSSLPLTGLGNGAMFSIEGRPMAPDERPIGLIRSVNASYFRTMGIRLLRGRAFTAADSARAPLVAVVSQTLERHFALSPSTGMVGSRLVLTNGRVAEIVGVVGDVKAEHLDSDDWPTIYLAYPQLPELTMTVVVRTAGPPRALASAVQREVHALDPDQPVADVSSLDAVVDDAMAGARFNVVVLAMFAILAFVLAAAGIYGVIAYDVNQRTHEFGIRMALGAQPGDVLKLVLGHGARLAACGVTAGLAAAFALTRLMGAMLYGVAATDALTFGAISLLLGAVALAATYVPSRRAMALDPVAALRHE